ncbi:hypothetical protein [Pollutibacter soli]|uniref:hypothetical protein n=1 Tax=Pollutibacter soli TaxID=3034157 RepID=UPI0030141C5D
MTLQYLIALVFFLPNQANSQVDFGSIRKQKLVPLFIDTISENIFVFEVRNATIYFRQDEVKNFIENPEYEPGFYHYGYKSLRENLEQKHRKIRVVDMYFSHGQSFRDSIFKVNPESLLLKQLNEEFYVVGAALMLKGRFMIYSKTENKILTKKLVARRESGYLGARYLQFYFPGKQSFYSIITALGE